MSDMFLQDRRPLAGAELRLVVGCLSAWSWHGPFVPLHLFPISRAESIKQGADGGWGHSSSCLDHGVYYLAVRALSAGEPAVTRPRLLSSSTRRAACQGTDRRRTGKRRTSNGWMRWLGKDSGDPRCSLRISHPLCCCCSAGVSAACWSRFKRCLPDLTI